MKSLLSVSIAIASFSVSAEALAAPAAPAGDYDTIELTKLVNPMLKAGGRNYDNGEKLFQNLGCITCHVFGDSGGQVGPNLSGVGGRFGAKDLLESILEPSAEVSSIYKNVVVTKTDGKTISGHRATETETEIGVIEGYNIDRITTRVGDTIAMKWEGKEPTMIKLSEVDSVEDSDVSPMPPRLIAPLSVEATADLLAFLISGGNPKDKMFETAATTAPAAAGQPGTTAPPSAVGATPPAAAPAAKK